MSAEILRLSDYTQDSKQTETRATTRAFMRRVDMNLININAQGFDYIARIVE